MLSLLVSIVSADVSIPAVSSEILALNALQEPRVGDAFVAVLYPIVLTALSTCFTCFDEVGQHSDLERF